ncbi:MAG TPA: autotransporter-associated beta strand repeat-containing protein [Opitutaceae bacterium]|nr:autotransporter-associated beta strand repeat-containing protein [Opitutaceae bacterium]
MGVAEFSSSADLITYVDTSAFNILAIQIDGTTGNLEIDQSGGGTLTVSVSITDSDTNLVYLSTGITGSPSVTVDGGGTLNLDQGVYNLGSVNVTNGNLGILPSATAIATSIGVGVTPGLTGSLSVEGFLNDTTGLYIGYNNGSTGTVTVDGDGGSITASTIYVGYSGTGSLSLTNGSSAFGGVDAIGFLSGSTGTAVVDDSLWTDTGLQIGYGGTGTLTLTDQGAISTTQITLGGNGGTGTLNIGAAATDSSASPGYVYNYQMYGAAGSTLQFNINNSSDNPYYFSEDGTGSSTQVIIGGPMDVVLTNGYLVMSADSSYTGGTFVNGGTLGLATSSFGTPGDIFGGPVGTGTLTLANGTTLVPYLDDITLANEVALTSGTVTFGDSNSYGLTLNGTISGSGGIAYTEYSTLTLTGSNTFSGGLEMESGQLSLGSSTIGSPGDFTSGPVGTGTLKMDENTSIALDGQDVTLANNIVLNGDYDYTEMAVEDSHSLTLTGAICGTGGIYWGSTGTLELSGNNTFQAGIEVNSGTLKLDSSTSTTEGEVESGPGGTGTLTFDAGTTLSIPEGSNICIANEIFINDSGGNPAVLTISGYTTGLLTLSGEIYDNDESGGALVIDSPVKITGDNSYTGGTTVNNTTLKVTTDSGLGTGSVTSHGSQLTFTSCSPYISYGDFEDNSTVTFTMTSGSPVFGELYMNNSTLSFADNSTPTIEDFDGDSPGDTSAIILGNNTALTFQDVPDPDYYGTISGAGSVNFFSEENAEYNLYGNNTYSGGTIVSGSAVLVAGSNTAFGASSGIVTVDSGATVATLAGITITNPITVQVGGSIGGFGTFAPSAPNTITIAGGSIIAGGTGTLTLAPNGDAIGSVGTLTLGSNENLSFGAAGIMQFSIMNATGSSGTDFSLINSGGFLDLTALSSSNPFFIQVVSIDPMSQMQGMANFTNTLPYSWVMLTAAGGISGFSSSDFIVDLESFQNPINTGQFYVSESGNSLVLNFSPVPEPSTWMMLACGAAGVAALAWRRRQAKAA